MNVLLFDQFSDPGGAQQGLLELLPALQRRGWRAVVGIPGEGELFPRIRALGFPAERIPCGPYRSGSKSLADAARFAIDTPRLAARIRGLVREHRADLVYINGPRLLPAAALARLDVPVVFHCHSYLFPGAIRNLAGRALRSLNAWAIGSCRFVADPWRPFVAAGRLRVIYNGVSGPAAPRRHSGEPVVACIGRIAPEKGQLAFVQAAALIRSARPDCRFVVYGAALFAEPGAERYDCEVRAAAAAVDIEFRGWTPDVYAALAQTDLLLVPSAGHEATTRVILEAYAAGVPVVAFRSGGIPEVVDRGRDGWLADSPVEMAELALDALALSSDGRAELSRRARRSWERRFTLNRYHGELLGALERAAGITPEYDPPPPDRPLSAATPVLQR